MTRPRLVHTAAECPWRDWATAWFLAFTVTVVAGSALYWREVRKHAEEREGLYQVGVRAGIGACADAITADSMANRPVRQSR